MEYQQEVEDRIRHAITELLTQFRQIPLVYHRHGSYDEYRPQDGKWGKVNKKKLHVRGSTHRFITILFREMHFSSYPTGPAMLLTFFCNACGGTQHLLWFPYVFSTPLGAQLC